MKNSHHNGNLSSSRWKNVTKEALNTNTMNNQYHKKQVLHTHYDLHNDYNDHHRHHPYDNH